MDININEIMQNVEKSNDYDREFFEKLGYVLAKIP